MKIGVPCNIRWKFYNTYDEVELENKFAPIPIKVPLETSCADALKNSARVSRDMKKSGAKMYAAYAFTIMMGQMLPTFALKLAAEIVSDPYTMAFSNTPGILKKIHYKDASTEGMTTAFVIANNVAISMGILSYAEIIQFSVVSDTCIKEDPKDMRDRMEAAIDELIALADKRTSEKLEKDIVSSSTTDTKKNE